MDKKVIFKGCCTALVTPFLNGSVDFISLQKLIQRQIALGADAIALCATTGEAPTLSDTEFKQITEFALSLVDHRIPVLLGTGSNNAEHALELTSFAKQAGADAVIAVTPYYNKCSQKGLLLYYEKLASVGIPIMLYNVPSRTGVSIGRECYRELASNENIVALKEAAADISFLAEMINEHSGKLSFYSGNDDLLLPMLSLGCEGCVSVTSNIIPSQIHAICKEYSQNRPKEAKELFFRYLPLFRVLMSEPNPIPVKCALNLLGLCSAELRLPLCSPDDSTLLAIARELEGAELL